MPASSLFSRLFLLAAQSGASDIHLIVDQPPLIRLHGVLQPLPKENTLTEKQLLTEIKNSLSSDHWSRYEQLQDIDTSYELSSGERFRLNIYHEQGRPALAARYIPAKIPNLEDLDVPPAVFELASKSQGLVLVTGPTGSGKSTLLAAMLEHINQERTEHIITLEDPIEFVHQSKKSIFSQRELGTDFPSFAEGLKHVFRQDPDIVMVGEMRDPETIALALTLAETGHLVLATLHTNSATQTVERIIDTFSAAQQQQIRLQLSFVLQGVISLLLLPDLEGTRIPVHEVLLRTHAVSNIIREGRTEQLRNVILTSARENMIDLDQELKRLVKSKIISAEVAEAYAHDPKSF